MTGRSRALLLVVALALVALVGGAAWAQEDDGEAVQGTLQADGEPVEGVAVIVSEADGPEVGQAVTDAEGAWRVPLPGPGDYIATLDIETLPAEVTLRDAERETLEFNIRSDQARTLLFPLGESEGVATAVLSRLPQSLYNGIKFGLIIGMAAIGLSLIFGTTGLINFAHGELVTMGAVVAWGFNAAGLHISLAAVASVIVCAVFAGLLDRGLWQPLRARRTGIIQLLVITVGLAFIIRHVILFFYGGRNQTYLDYTIMSPVELGPLRTNFRDLTVIALAIVVLVGVGLLVTHTRLGKAMRAVADNRELAETTGIDVQRVILLVWVVGGGLTALGGVLLGVTESVNYFMGFRLLLLIFAGVILGGLGTAHGAMVGGLVIGIITELSTIWFSPDLKDMWALLVLILILLFRPQGILGLRERIG